MGKNENNPGFQHLVYLQKVVGVVKVKYIQANDLSEAVSRMRALVWLWVKWHSGVLSQKVHT